MDQQHTPPRLAGGPPPTESPEAMLNWALDSGINAVMGMHNITHGEALRILRDSIERRAIVLIAAIVKERQDV